MPSRGGRSPWDRTPLNVGPCSHFHTKAGNTLTMSARRDVVADLLFQTAVSVPTVT